jgi:hypothetical protein
MYYFVQNDKKITNVDTEEKFYHKYDATTTRVLYSDLLNIKHIHDNFCVKDGVCTYCALMDEIRVRNV